MKNKRRNDRGGEYGLERNGGNGRREGELCVEGQGGREGKKEGMQGGEVS